MKKIYLSLIAAKILEIKSELKKFEPYCSGFHLDVMDNHQVPNLTFGADFVNQIATVATKQLFIHLMIEDPNTFIQQLKIHNDDIIAFQLKSAQDPATVITTIKNKQLLSSIAINPDTPIKSIFPFINTLDQVLIMSVQAGFSGQDFIPECIEKARSLIQYRKDNNLTFEIAMDGGIDENNIKELANIGVDAFAIGSGIFDTPNPLATLKKLNALINS
ncbi:ribulose-phosphate 3-epimerase [bacterium]|jgi:ribulose-phosphate 3-epimerase|nr:ribulose-phosphate 3-epimerase [bacterium]MBT5015765.1 ribulose-phosphate 3-epimerase [bacterium]